MRGRGLRLTNGDPRLGMVRTWLETLKNERGMLKEAGGVLLYFFVHDGIGLQTKGSLC